MQERGLGRPVQALALGLVVLQPFWTLLPLVRRFTPGAPIGLFDVLLVVLTACSGPDLRRAVVRPPDRASRLAVVLVGLVFVAFLVHPSVAGALTPIRLCGATCLWMALRSQTSMAATRRVAGALVAVAVFEAALAVAQITVRQPVGGGVLTAASWPMNLLGHTVAPRGTFQHQFPLAAFSLLATFVGLALLPTLRRETGRRMALALAVTAVPIGITFSRTALIGLAAGLVATMLVARPHDATVMLGIAAAAVGALVPALLWRGGWESRIETGAAAITARNPDLFASSRLHLAHGALVVVRDHPLAGIGPGRYTPGSAVAAQVSPSFPEEIVHDLPLFFAAEDGLPAGILAAVIVVGVGVVALRRGRSGFPLFAAVLPFLVIDRLCYDGAHGLAFTAIWLAAVELVGRAAPADLDG